jgi:hypothetical protein
VLVSQDCHKIEQFLRKGKTDWTVKVYTEKKESCILTVGVKISLEELYKNLNI